MAFVSTLSPVGPAPSYKRKIVWWQFKGRVECSAHAWFKKRLEVHLRERTLQPGSISASVMVSPHNGAIFRAAPSLQVIINRLEGHPVAIIDRVYLFIIMFDK